MIHGMKSEEQIPLGNPETSVQSHILEEHNEEKQWIWHQSQASRYIKQRFHCLVNIFLIFHVHSPETAKRKWSTHIVRIGFETSLTQPEEIDIEKQAIYNPTVDYYKKKYNLDSIFVKGLMVGARGIIPAFLSDFWRSFGLPKHHLQEIAVAALRGSVALLRNHLYLTT
ncbi:hypothetical protein C0J52_17822 [Blattella germanica]|nr:hypothetical protein C0J52_17822 [Blattella germanica]